MENIIGAIHSVFGECDVKPKISVKDTAQHIFKTMDVDKDGKVSEEEFIKCCLREKSIFDMLQLKT